MGGLARRNQAGNRTGVNPNNSQGIASAKNLLLMACGPQMTGLRP